MDYATQSLQAHKEWKGKIEVVAKVPTANKHDLSLAYTPALPNPVWKLRRTLI